VSSLQGTCQNVSGKESKYAEKAMKRDFQKLLGLKTLWEHIGEVFVDAIERLPAPQNPTTPAKPSSFDEEEFGFMFSDSQIGEVVNPKGTGNLGNYSTAVFEERLEFLKESLNKIFAIHMNEIPYNRINLFFIGDIIEGSTIFKGQQRSIDLMTVQQIIKAVDKISYFVAWLAMIFPQVSMLLRGGKPWPHRHEGRK